MPGKKNIVFGFIYLALTAAVGAVIILGHFDERRTAENSKTEKLGVLQQIVVDGYEVNLEEITSLDLAKTNSQAILAISNRINAQKPISRLRSGAHAHGTADALLNIAVGFLLMFLTAPVWLKQIISWMFITGAVLHSGMLFLVSVLGQTWASVLLNGPPGAIGRGLTLTGLVLAGIAAAKWFSATLVSDDTSTHQKTSHTTINYKTGLNS